MADVKLIRPIWGEFADQNIELPTADADQAIADGWAFDPYSETPRELPPLLSDDARLQMEEKSAIAISKARGDDYLEPSEPNTKPGSKAPPAEAPAPARTSKSAKDK